MSKATITGWTLDLQVIVTSPELAKLSMQQIVETEHLLKSMLEQPNGLARRILQKAGSDPSRLLQATDSFIKRQPRVTGEAGQACTHTFSFCH